MISIIIPTYNEENTIMEVIRNVQNCGVATEIIVIDDGSTDTTRVYFEKKHSGVIYRQNSMNMGKGYSIGKGIEYATCDIIVIQDADLEYDPKEIPRLIQPILDDKADVVYGSRFKGNSNRVLFFWHYVGNKFLTLLSNMFTNLNLTDMETCYKAFRADVIKKITLEENRFGFEPEVTAKLAKAGARFWEIGISYNGRTYEQGKKINWKDGFSAIRCILKYGIFNAK